MGHGKVVWIDENSEEPWGDGGNTGEAARFTRCWVIEVVDMARRTSKARLAIHFAKGTCATAKRFTSPWDMLIAPAHRLSLRLKKSAPFQPLEPLTLPDQLIFDRMWPRWVELHGPWLPNKDYPGDTIHSRRFAL